MPTRAVVLIFPLFLLAAAAPIVAQQPPQPNARAEAHAQASSTGGESRSATHRVVVVNGRTVVDERTVNGRPVGAGGDGGRGPMPAPVVPGVDGSDEMMRRVQEELRRQLESQGLPPLPLLPPLPQPPARPRATPHGKPQVR